MYALTNCRIHIASKRLEAPAVLIEGRHISDIVEMSDIPADIPQHNLDGGHLAPGFIDVQVNGGGGVMFNTAPTVETIARMAKTHRRFGTVGFLPTLITDERGHIRQAIDAVCEALAAATPGVLGIHLEGPIINPERKGMHDAGHIGALDAEIIDGLGAVPGARVVTLAPECAPPGLIAQLTAAGIRVSAGHTQATAEQVTAAQQAGLLGVTHLFNAMTQFTGRAPGAVGAALANADLWCGIIADGVHVHETSILAAWRAKQDKLFLVTDAMAPVGTEMAAFEYRGEKVTVRDGSCFLANGCLAGSTLDMASAVRNCVRNVLIPLEAALRMASTHPAEFLGLGDSLGKIATGYDASLVWLDDDLMVKATWVKGHYEYHG
ncbi:MAG: N-acetylglucosamine-6-phosphate deacetylase [Proteobacteria bacterium]|nr:N-acetylglucosamine-6-phosphate deacetylase [Pseudomonadota bacterium]MDA1354991.1 N-acetylglucosamine-6-phosphate deacetylase [Pseudomonadota bacterium]